MRRYQYITEEKQRAHNDDSEEASKRRREQRREQRQSRIGDGVSSVQVGQTLETLGDDLRTRDQDAYSVTRDPSTFLLTHEHSTHHLPPLTNRLDRSSKRA